jgi:hypothetical protein
MLQPGSRHWKPALRKIASSPSASASRLTRSEPGHHPGGHAIGDMPPARDSRGVTQIRQARVGAGADENPVDPGAFDRLAGNECHVGERLLPGLAPRRIGRIGRIGDRLVDRDRMLGAGAPGDGRRDVGDVNDLVAVERRIIVARQLTPLRHRAMERFAFWREAAAFDIGEGGLVRRDKTDLGAEFDGQVADGHAPFHPHRPDGVARVFDGMAGAGRSADPADEMEDQVFRRHARPRLALEPDPHRLGLALPQRLRPPAHG